MIFRLIAAAAVLSSFASFPTKVAAQPKDLAACLPVLTAKDYYSYASTNNLKEDYLRTIDSQTWQEIKTSNNFEFTGLFSGGLFSVSDDYSTFDSKRTKYLESVHYSRDQQQATNILKITTSPRAYPAYEACLRGISSGLTAWASKESQDEIELHVKYANPANVKSILLEGHVRGGSVKGVPKGHIWKDSLKWGINQEKTFVINTDRGVPETNVLISPSDGSAPVSLTFFRADGLLQLTFDGTTDVLRSKDRQASAVSPNNDHNTGGCPNQQGKKDNKWCISRTSVSLATSPPNVLKNPRAECGGDACPWATLGPASLSPDSRTASAFVDNWGSAVRVVIKADEYETMSAAQCGGDGPIPVIRNQAVLLAATTDCLSIATLKWTLLPENSVGVFRFGDKAAPNGAVVAETVLDNKTALLVSYKIVR